LPKKNWISIRLELPHPNDSTNMINFIGGSGETLKQFLYYGQLLLLQEKSNVQWSSYIWR
jgi:hypothetical protein